MSVRSKIEITSWISGILSALVAIFLLIKPDGLGHSEKSQSQVPTKITEIKIERSNLNSKTVASTNPNTVKSEFCQSETGNLSTALDSAKQIYSTTTRDKMYLNIARRALCIDDLKIYEAAVAAIYTTTSRDQAYTEGVDYYLHAKSHDTALSIAQRIYQTTVRDEAFARIASRTTNQ